MNTIHWHILGAGAVGSLFAINLHKAGIPVSLILREPPETPCIDLTLQDGASAEVYHLPVASAQEQKGITHLLVTTKAYDVHSAIAQWVHRLAPGCQILVMVNGMGIAQRLQLDYPQMEIFSATTTTGAYRIRPQQVTFAGSGETRIGKQGLAQQPPWFGPFADAVQDCIWDDSIEESLWAKLAINCVINPLTAVHECLNGELATRHDLTAKVTALTAEVAAICQAAGFSDIATHLPERVAAVVAGTARNRSSMLQDRQKGRATEIDFITGYLLEIATQHGIAAPLNNELLETLRERSD